MPQEMQFESHLKKTFALLILTLITRHKITLSLLFFYIPARMSVSLPFVLNQLQKSHLIDMHACNHCSASSRAQT